jgi:hypothetical protein
VTDRRGPPGRSRIRTRVYCFFRHRTYFVFTDAVIAVLVAVTLLPVLDTVVAAIAFACTAVVDFFKCSLIYFPGTVIAFTMLLPLLLSLPL